MAITKLTAGEDLIRYTNIRPKRAEPIYTPVSLGVSTVPAGVPAVGDLVGIPLVAAATTADSVVRAPVDTNPYGIILSVNSGNGTLSVAELQGGAVLRLEYFGTAPSLGGKVEAIFDATNPTTIANTGRGLLLPTRDRVRADNANGAGRVLYVETVVAGASGSGFVIVQFAP